jgi:hypothetical protein
MIQVPGLSDAINSDVPSIHVTRLDAPLAQSGPPPTLPDNYMCGGDPACEVP